MIIISNTSFADTCSISITGGDDKKFGEYHKVKIKNDSKLIDKDKHENWITFYDIEADPELGNVSIQRRSGKLKEYRENFYIGKANKVMNFKFVSDVKDLDKLPAGTYQAKATIVANCLRN